MNRAHTHRCGHASCREEFRCDGYPIDNYDGWPAVLCSAQEAARFAPSGLLCTECDEAVDRRCEECGSCPHCETCEASCSMQTYPAAMVAVVRN